MAEMSTCSGCGTEVAADFAFCPRCGQRQTGVAAPRAVEPGNEAPSKPEGREADRRQVTVLFADLSGFTALAERLDPEVVRAFQNALFETLARTITRYEGFVEKFVGDAVLAVFGAPVAHEDDPARACQAALAMLEGGAALSQGWAARLGQPVALHVGIHTGPVVAGSLGGAAGAAYAVTGDTVNTTSRLLAAAAPGTILVSAATQALVGHGFAFEPAGGRARAARQSRAHCRPSPARRARRAGVGARSGGPRADGAAGRPGRGARSAAGRVRPDAAGTGPGGELGGRGRDGQVAPHRRAVRAARRHWPARRHGRPPGGVLVPG